MRSELANSRTRSSGAEKGRRAARGALIWLAGGGILFVVGGCQPADGPARIAVFGTVTSESGDPLNGMISFLPEAGTKGPAATASLIDGIFKFDMKNGPVAGQYRVLVVKHLADRKHKGASVPAPDATVPAATPGDGGSAADVEWSFAADVSLDNVEFDFEVPDAAADLTSG